MKILLTLSLISYAILLLYLFFKKQKSMLSKIYISFKKLSFYKKIIFIFIYQILLILWPIFYIFVILNMIKYVLLILVNLGRTKVLEIPKINQWDDFFEIFIEFVEFKVLLKLIIKNIIYAIKKNAFLRVYVLIKKNKKIDINSIETILFIKIFSIPLYLLENLIEILNINYKLKKKK